MDHLFLDLIGKPELNPPKVISVVAENFSFLEDQARFLKATLAIPEVKKLPFDNISKRLIQIGPLQNEIGEQVRRNKWAINQYEDFDESICDRIEEDLTEVRNRSVIFVNDVSRLELASASPNEPKKLLKLAEKLKRQHGHFIVLIYQASRPQSSTTLLRDMEYLSDAMVKVQSCKAGYFKSIWWQTVPPHKTLIPPKVETSYYTCKIGKSYWSTDLLCFYERKQVPKNYDLDTDTYLDDGSEGGANEVNDDDDANGDDDDEDKISNQLHGSRLNRPSEEELESTLPYVQARNPEQSRIFYYPDKEDDIDEDDPDNDLGI